MRNVIPESVIASIRHSYIHGVAAAEKGYVYAQDDEDVVTGALGQSLLSEDQSITSDGNVYIWRTTYHKFRGRGKNAHERIFGADGIFQIEIQDSKEGTIFRKGLLFQAKKEWRGIDNNLKRQAKLLSFPPEVAIIIDYTANGYYACSAVDAFHAEGDRRKLPSGSIEPLSDTLVFGFLYCEKGVADVFFDVKSKELFLPLPFGPVKRISYRHVISSKIIRVSLT